MQSFTRRGAIAHLFATAAASPSLAVTVSAAISGAAADVDRSMPHEVAGIKLPQSPIARIAAQFSRRNCPDYLFNHCMRTFLFGAISMRSMQHAYNPDTAFAAAALHDLGLLSAFRSKTGSFEIDGADRAERLMRASGLSPHDSDTVWHAIALHDVRFAIAARQGPEAMLVAVGAGSDVDGPDTDTIDAKQTAEIVTAFPRLNFKKQFLALAIDHCQHKPLSQRATWLEGLCREHAPAAWTDTVEHEITDAPFAQ